MREATTAPPLVWSRAFPAIPVCTREARRFLSSIVTGCPAADNAILCLSELVTNAIVHSRSRAPGGQFFVHVYRRENMLRVEVTDQGGAWRPEVAPAADVLPGTEVPPGTEARSGAEVPPGTEGRGGGRGLLIVARLARSWGRTGDESGRTIWFEMECW